MNLNITGKDFELTDAIKSYTSEKVEKLSKYLGDDFSAVATFEIHGEEQIAELRITVGSTVYKATTASKDLYSSIDKNIGILEGQIRKSKTKKDKQNMVETIRIQEKEILDFIQEDKNLKTLGESLNRLPMNASYLSQKILN